jgi:two-component system, chemotaxis family, chemotaxis protein CheY
MRAADMKVLVVDDFATMRCVLRSLLLEIGCAHVEEADDGGLALTMLREGGYDLVVSDIDMPAMSGFELLAAIRGDDALKHVQVLMTTAEPRRQDVVRAAREGAAGCVVKPFSKTTLEAKMQKIVRRRSARG